MPLYDITALPLYRFRLPLTALNLQRIPTSAECPAFSSFPLFFFIPFPAQAGIQSIRSIRAGSACAGMRIRTPQFRRCSCQASKARMRWSSTHATTPGGWCGLHRALQWKSHLESMGWEGRKVHQCCTMNTSRSRRKVPPYRAFARC